MNWQQVVNALIAQSEAWAQEAGFSTLVQPSEERPDVNVLSIDNGRQKIHVEPAVYAAERLPTAVDVYAYPSLVRVRLRGPDVTGAWEIFTADNLPLRRAWNQNTFLELCADLAVAA